jgi:hypothetical protein
MKRDAILALTEHGGSNVNRLRVPELRVLHLFLKKSKESSSHLPRNAPGPAPKGSDDFHFAPSVETVTLNYQIEDIGETIEKAELQVYSRFNGTPLWTLDLTKLGRDWYSHGTHEVEWDGRLPGAPAAEKAGEATATGFKHKLGELDPKEVKDVFPDGYLTVEHSPYKLRLEVSSSKLQGNPVIAWTYLHVLVQKIELEYGDEKMLPKPVAGQADHRETLKDLVTQGAKPPAEGAAKAVKVHLDSDVYKTDSARMFDNTLYTKYETLWGDGPLIPLLAKVYLRDSGGKAVLAPKALGRVRFLWDWESKSAAVADAFAAQAQDYYKDTTKPKGQNCHKDRGGKRADDTKPVFPAQAGYAAQDTLKDGDFPFEVVAVSDKRKWAAYSYAWREKLLESKTGVLFQPARMAGDCWTVTVYLAWDKKADGKFVLDDERDAPLLVQKEIKAATGKFEVWRRTHLRKHVRKTAAGMPAVSLAAICSEFERAFLNIDNVAGAPEDFTEADWNTAYTTATNGWNATEKLFLKAVNQHSEGAAGVYFRNRDEFTVAWRARRIKDALTAAGVGAALAATAANAAAAAASAANASAAAVAAGVPAAHGPAVEGAWNHVTNFMNNPANGYDTNANYATQLQAKGLTVLYAIFDGKFAGDGTHLFQVERVHNLVHHQASVTIGIAHDFASANENRCAFMLMSPAGAVPCGIDKISAHEIGHHYFLPHPKGVGTESGYSAHDETSAVSTCLMSYNFGSVMELCGFCQLRLRGWDKSKLDPSGAPNKKP